MDDAYIMTVLDQYARKEISREAALEELSRIRYQDLGFAKIDHHRARRTGFPEVIYCEGKSIDMVLMICREMQKRGSDVLGTRADPKMAAALRDEDSRYTYNEQARVFFLEQKEKKRHPGIVVACGGTTDLPVAEEASVTARIMGNEVLKLYDVGVAGLHRLLAYVDDLQAARVIIAVAGMEGALPSVISGLVSCPVIAVPTSVGYGANFGGISALLTMLNSCSPGISTVNIDNGFGAGYLAAVINRQSRPAE